MELRRGRFFQSSVLHCPNRWVAIRSTNPQAVQTALGLHNPTPCSWMDGMARVSDQKLFISPPVNGWVLVVGSLLPEPSEDVDACFRFLQRLSRELGEVQFFSVNRAVGHHAWARFERAVDVVAKSPPQHRTKMNKRPVSQRGKNKSKKTERT